MINANSTLFTELTAEEGSTISGGALELQIKWIQCVKAGADIVGADETRLKVGGKEIWKGDMSAGKEQFFDTPLKAPVNNGTFVGLYDDDGWFSRDDYMGGFNVSGPKGATTVTLSGSGSIYQVRYAVVESVDPF